MKRKIGFFEIILNITLILLTILVIYWFLQLIFGGSPELSNFNFALIVLIGGFLVKIYREIGEIKIDSKHNFSQIKNSFNLIRTDLGLVKDKLKI